MNRKLFVMILAMILCFAGSCSVAFADDFVSSPSAQPAENISYQYNENGILEVVTVETSFPDGSRKTSITILDPVLQLPVSEDTVIYARDGSRETLNVVYTRDASGNLLEKSSVTVERDGSELKDLITNNSFGRNTYRRTECFDKSGNLMMSEETAYVYNAENILMSSMQSSFQQNGHNIKTVVTYDEAGENPVEATTDYSYADGSSGTVTKVYSTEEPTVTSVEEAPAPVETESSSEQELPSSEPISLSVDLSSAEDQTDAAAASDL
ncbi:MAG: hypothetical protein IJG40_15620 [Oscillospiraceae bacterium]|nr:hypothetical protein [Oscillospiraceae bacterium]